MEVSRVGVENRHLFLCCLHDGGVTMSYVAHVVDRIEILPLVFVVQILHDAPHDLERLLVRDAQGGSDVPLPGREKGVVFCRCVLHASVKRLKARTGSTWASLFSASQADRSEILRYSFAGFCLC